MKMSFSSSDVTRISKLANISVTEQESRKLAKEFTATMEVVDKLFTVDVTGVSPTHQVTGKSNTLREDEIDETRMFTQEQALSNAEHTHNGYVVVPAVLNEEK